MKKSTLVFLFSVLCLSLISFSFKKESSANVSKRSNDFNKVLNEDSSTIPVHDHVKEVQTLSSNIYSSLDLKEKGMSKNVLDVAVKGYLTLKEEKQLKNDSLLTIVDLSQSSRKNRFYLIDVKNGKLVENILVAHAKNSGVDVAENFSNEIGSEKSSLGFYVTKETYIGKHGLSLRLAGLEKGYNDNAEKRAVVVHGADYVNEARINSPYMGRSQGCPAIPMKNYVQVINKIKSGSALFLYYPDSEYLSQSEILNG